MQACAAHEKTNSKSQCFPLLFCTKATLALGNNRSIKMRKTIWYLNFEPQFLQPVRLCWKHSKRVRLRISFLTMFQVCKHIKLRSLSFYFVTKANIELSCFLRKHFYMQKFSANWRCDWNSSRNVQIYGKASQRYSLQIRLIETH